MEKAIKEFERIFTERILHYKNFNSFGEDSIRYDFFNALINIYNLKPYQFQLEFPIPIEQFENKIKKENSGRGRHEYKPEVDLLIDPINSFDVGIVAEFAYFRKPEKAKNQDKTGKHGKIFNEIFRLALMKNHQQFNNYKCYLICVTDDEMINYAKEGTRGSTPIGIQDEYLLNHDFLRKIKSTAIGKIDDKFKLKVAELSITPSAKRIFNIKSKSNLNWEIWVWEIDYVN
jgi:hypothetical protein